MNKPQRRDAPDLSVVRELLGDIPGESIEDAAVRVAARLQAEIDLRRAVEAERDQANAAAAVANKRRALLLLAARAACKRLRADRNDWRRSFEAAAAVAGGYRSRLAAALARAYDTERLYRRAEDQRAAAESALETLEGQATLAEERAQALTNELAEGRAALSFARTVHARQRRWIIWGKLRRERDRHAVRRLRKERADLRAELGELTRERDQVRAHLGAAVDEHTEEAAARIVRELAASPPREPTCGDCDHWPSVGGIVRWCTTAAGDRHRECRPELVGCTGFAPAAPTVSSPGARAAGAGPGPRIEQGKDLSLPPGHRWTPHFWGWLVWGPSKVVGSVDQLGPSGAAGWTRYREGNRVESGDCETETAARAALAAAVRHSFATEPPDHCSNDHAYPGAFRALSPQACSGAGDQPCTGEQSSPEPEWMTLGELVCAVDADGRELGQNFDGLDPCSPAQPARPIRAGREGRGAGRFPRGGGRPGVSVASGGAHSGKVGIMASVAKAGPSPADRESAVNQGERARLGNPECATGALAGGPEPRAGDREGWFGTVGEGERVDPGGALRVAVAVLGAVDLVWWLCVRLLYLCGRRADEEPRRPGARYLGIGWQRAAVNGGALCEAWIGFVPVDAEPRDGWPVGWRWDALPLEPPGWSFNPDVDDRASQEPGSIGILVRDGGGRARLAFWATAWGDRWAAPGFDAARLVRLLRAEITDAELRAEERDETEDYPDDEDDPDAPEPAATSPQPAWMQDAPPLPAGLVWGWDGVWMKVFDPSGDEVASAVHDGHAWLWKVGGRWAGAKNRRAAMLKIAEALATQEAEQRNAAAAAVVAAERPPATCRTGQDPAAGQSPLDSLPPLPSGYGWHLSRATGEPPGRVTVWNGDDYCADLEPGGSNAWNWRIIGSKRLGPAAVGAYDTRERAAARIARELYRRVDEATLTDELERQEEGGQG